MQEKPVPQCVFARGYVPQRVKSRHPFNRESHEITNFLGPNETTIHWVLQQIEAGLADQTNFSAYVHPRATYPRAGFDLPRKAWTPYGQRKVCRYIWGLPESAVCEWSTGPQTADHATNCCTLYDARNEDAGILELDLATHEWLLVERLHI